MYDYYSDGERDGERDEERDGERDEDVRYTWAGPFSTSLYGKHIKRLSEVTRCNLDRLQSSMSDIDFYRRSQNNSKMNSMFSEPGSSAFCLSSSSSCLDEMASPAFNFCYLCSTLEEHERNHLHSYPKKAVKARKPRIEYIAPVPRVRRKQTPVSTGRHDALYRVVVFVGDRPGAGTDSNVYVSILGSTDELPRQRLYRGNGKTKFCFTRGAVEKFYLKGPKLGNLQILTIEIDGLEKKHGLYINKVEVTDMLSDLTWVFLCNNWLSLHHGDYSIRRDLEAVQKDRPIKEYEVTIVTGKKKLAGTDSNVFLTLHGTERTSHKIHLNKGRDRSETFNRGSSEVFNISLRDIGEIKSIRVEHDGKGMADGWNLEKIVIKNRDKKKEVYYFLYGGWIATDEGDGSLWREIKAKRKLDKLLLQGCKTKYEVTVETGDRRYAGTDANVFIQFVGEKGSTKQLKLDDARNNFERGMVESFVVYGLDVGDLKNIIIGHDNSGPGAGWFLENVQVKKYFTKAQIKEKIEKLRSLKKDGGDVGKRDDDDDDDDDDDVSKYIAMGRRRSSVSGRKARERSRDDDDDDVRRDREKERRRSRGEIKDIFDREGNVLRWPVYEEYKYGCGQWLATNEGDGRTQRELVHFDKQVFYQEKNEA